MEVDEVVLVEQLGELVAHNDLTEDRSAAIMAEVIRKPVLLRARDDCVLNRPNVVAATGVNVCGLGAFKR